MSWTLSKETRRKIGLARLGTHLSDITKRKIGIANAISNKGKTKEKCSAWKGGRIKQCGYIKLHLPEHPFADSKDYYQEHRYLMEQHIGRLLEPEERVHHKNGIKSDNRLENLMLVSDMAHHRMLHRKQWVCNKCAKVHYAKGLCFNHYVIQWKKDRKNKPIVYSLVS